MTWHEFEEYPLRAVQRTYEVLGSGGVGTTSEQRHALLSLMASLKACAASHCVAYFFIDAPGTPVVKRVASDLYTCVSRVAMKTEKNARVGENTHVPAREYGVKVPRAPQFVRGACCLLLPLDSTKDRLSCLRSRYIARCEDGNCS